MANTKTKVSFEDYRKAMEERGENDRNEMSRIGRGLFLWCFIISINIITYLFSQGFFIKHVGPLLHSIVSKMLVPYFIISIIFTILFLLKATGVFKSFQCPKCKCFLPNGKLEKFDSFQGSGLGVTSSGDFYSRQDSTTVYWTECKYCGNIIWVLR